MINGFGCNLVDQASQRAAGADLDLSQDVTHRQHGDGSVGSWRMQDVANFFFVESPHPDCGQAQGGDG